LARGAAIIHFNKDKPTSREQRLQTLITGTVGPVPIYTDWHRFDLQWSGCCSESVSRSVLNLVILLHFST